MVPGKKLRVLILLAVLGWVAADLLADRLNTTDWKQTLWVGVYPFNADGSRRAADYIANLQAEDFTGIEAWFVAESRRYGLNLEPPVRLRLGPVLTETPPLPPRDAGVIATTWWSIRLHWWADGHDRLADGLRPDVRLYLLYYDPEANPALPHSLGLQKGLVGIVHAFADPAMAGSNRVVITHELLHTLGASDKYDLVSSQPLYPQGYAAPVADPLYPQAFAEIMGGRTPLSATTSEIPRDVDRVRIGDVTAAEIRWK